MSIDYIAMGKRIALKRHEQKLTQKQVCEAIDIDDKYLSIIENAKSIPSIDTLTKICCQLHTSLDYIVLGIPDKRHKEAVDELYRSLNQMNPDEVRFINAVIKVLDQQKKGELNNG